MADTSVAVTPGSGAEIDFRSEGTNGDLRQVVVIGDPATNAGVAPVDATNGLSVSVTNATLAATQSGTWTVDLGATDNAVLDAIAASLAGTLTVGSHAVTNAGTFAVQAAQSGTWNVTVNAALPAGTNNIGDVDIASIAAGDNNIGNVDIVTVPTDPFGANADAASATGSISAKLRGIATALGITAFDLGSGTGGSRTLRWFQDTAQWIGGAGSVSSATQRVTLASDDPAVASLSVLDDWDSSDAAKTVGFAFSCSTDVTRPAADTTQYSANDALSDSTSAPTSGGFTFTSAARASGGSGIITDAIITTDNDSGTPLQGEIWLFNTSVTNINDNSAFAVSDSEIKTVVGKIPFALEDAGNNGFAHVSGLNITFTCSGSANLRFLVRVKNAYTPVGSEVLTFKIAGVQLT